jgi:DNA-binding LacI/PurR family transcriptional regulator
MDDVPAARLASPPLTTVRVDLSAVSAQLADRIAAGLAGAPAPDPPGPAVHTVVARESA